MTWGRWLLAVCVVPGLALVLLAAAMLDARSVVRRPDYAAHVLDPSVAVQDLAMDARGRRCDILVDGDSTALHGIDPRILTAATGLSACNIANPRPVWVAAGSFPLDHFLANNPAPKWLILQFSPEFLYTTGDWQGMSIFAPYVMLLRHGPPGLTLRTAVLHPGESVQMLKFLLTMELAHPPAAELARRRQVYDRTLAEAIVSGGRIDPAEPPGQGCDVPPHGLTHAPDAEFVSTMRRRYEARGIRTLIVAAPVPDCDSQLHTFTGGLGGLLDDAPRSLPRALFVADDRHMTAAGAAVQSRHLAQLIQSRLARP
jgi:hypothetical protein